MCDCELCQLKKQVQALAQKVVKGRTSCTIEGTVTGFRDNGIVAEVMTANGLALLDINVGGGDWFPEIKISDVVEVEEMGYYITNGLIYACVGDSITINGQHY